MVVVEGSTMTVFKPLKEDGDMILLREKTPCAEMDLGN